MSPNMTWEGIVLKSLLRCKFYLAPILAVCAATCVCSVASGADRQQSARSLRDIFGVTHVNGRYHLTDREFLIEGADKIASLGANAIKLYLMVPPKSYRFNTVWPQVGSLVELARTPQYRAVFSKPFTTYFLTAYSVGRFEHYWIHGISDAQVREETERFHRLARHFLTEYRGSGKTFVLQHWEGDWAVRGSFNRTKDPTETAFRGMIRWLNARQAGVDRAREEVGQEGVRVFHAAEVNLVRMGMIEKRPTVAARVLPHTRVDLVSYSAWDTQDDRESFRRALDFIANHVPDRPPFDAHNVYVGEFGVPENERTPEKLERTLANVVDVGLEWGCPYLVYWQVYCNEFRRDQEHPTAPVTANDQVRGFWLLRPDGTKGRAWDFFERRLRDSP